MTLIISVCSCCIDVSSKHVKVSENSEAHCGAIGWLAVRHKITDLWSVAVLCLERETFKRLLVFEPTSSVESGSPPHCFQSFQTLKEASKKKKM